jgi:hypothetical protein
MANNLGYTPGSGAEVTTTQCSSDGSEVQHVALSAVGATGDRTLLPVDATKGLGIQVLAIASGLNIPITNPTGQNLNVNVTNASVTVTGTVGISGAVAATQSGAWNIGTVTSITNPVTVTGTVGISGTVAATQSGAWNIGTVTSITNPVTVTGTVGISGTPVIAGTVTANQGAAAATAGAWPMKVTDGTSTAGTQTINSNVGLNVAVIGGSGLGYSQQDGTAFTAGTSPAQVDGGVFSDGLAALSSGQSGAFRITPNRALHVDLRRQDGTEVGTNASPLYVQASTANFPMNVVQIGGMNLVTAAAGVQKVGISDATGTAFSAANPLPVAPAQNPGFWSQHVTFGASASAIAIHTPAAGKTVYVQGIVITPTAAGAILKIFDNADSDTTELYNGQPPATAFTINFTPARPLAAVNNILRYSTGASAAGDFVVWGYDA